jgi:hypothetical protein
MTPEQIENVTKGMSRNAADLWRIAVKLAGFDPVELLAEILKGQRVYAKVKESTVTGAMQRIQDRDMEARPELYHEELRLRDESLVKLLGNTR